MRSLLCLFSSISLLISGCAAKANPNAPDPAVKTIAEEDSPKTIPMPSGRGNDFESMTRVITFTPEQRAKFDAAVNARNEAYDNWTKSDRGKRYTELRAAETAARRQRDQAKLKEIQTELTELRAEQEKLRADLRRELNKSLTLDQQRQWASHALFLRATTAVERTGMPEARKAEAKSITDRIAAERVTPETADRDPYLLLDEAAVKRASDEIHKPSKRL